MNYKNKLLKELNEKKKEVELIEKRIEEYEARKKNNHETISKLEAVINNIQSGKYIIDEYSDSGSIISIIVIKYIQNMEARESFYCQKKE